MRNRSREDILKQIDRVLCEQEMIRQPLPKIWIDNNIARVLTKALEILGNQFLRDKELEEKTLELIKSDFDLMELPVVLIKEKCQINLNYSTEVKMKIFTWNVNF